MQANQYIQLIYKQLSGGLDSAEQKQLDNWLAASAENQQTARAIEKAWELSDDYEPTDLPDIDLEGDFARLEARLNAADQQTATIRVLPTRRRLGLRIAAAVALLVVAGFLVRQWLVPAVDWQSVTTLAGEQRRVELADGSKVWLNENTSFQYPSTFTGKEREVKLDGEAFFEVAKRVDQAFTVQSISGTVQVLGTSFNVRDIRGEASMKVQVKTGRVRVDNLGATANIILTAGEQAQIRKQDNTLTKVEEPIDNALFWQSKILIFNNQPLQQVLADLRAAYKVDIQLTNTEMLTCPFSSNFKQKSIEHILKTMATVFEMELINQDDKTYQLKGGRCQ